MTWAARRKRCAFKNARKMKTRNEVNPLRLGSSFGRRATLLLMALFVLLLFGVLATAAFGAPPPVDQPARWKTATVDPRRRIELDKLIARYQADPAPYQTVERMHANGVPAVVAFGLFYREADNNLRCSPAQGDSLARRSVNVPRGRIPGKNPPFLWTDAAYDAYYVVDHLDRTNWRDTASALDKVESFNGFGYRGKGVPAPYLWSGTSLYGVLGAPRGKYVRDGVFDRNATDAQAGVCAILLRMKERGITMPF